VVKKRTYLLGNESSRELSIPGAKVLSGNSENTEERKVPEPQWLRPHYLSHKSYQSARI